MKYFIVAALAAVAIADLDKEDVRDALMDFKDCPECAISKAERDAEEEVQKEVEQFMEDLECWWAERNNGDGDCAKRRREAEMEACWQQEGMEWHYERRECMTREERESYRQIDCVDEGGRWGKIREDWGEQCIYPRDEDMAACMGSSNQAEWDWDSNTCYESWDAMQAGRKDRCIADGGAWRSLAEGWGEECYIAGKDAWADCKVSGTDSGTVMEYDWDSKTCMDAKQYCEVVQGQQWNAEGQWCEWVKVLSKKATSKQYSKMMRNIAQKPQAQRVLASYSAQFNIPQLEEITKPVEDGEREGEQLVQDMMAEWGPKLEEWYVAQQAREQQAFEELTQVILDSVSVDGKTLRELSQQEAEAAFMAKKLRNAKSVRSFVMQEADMQQADEPQNVKITFEGPNQQELEEWLAGIKAEAESIGSTLGQIAEEYGRKYDDLNDELEDALEPVGETLEDLANRVGDDVKKVTDSATTEFYALAMKKAKSAAAASSKQKKSNGFYYGMASGAMGVFAATALYAACKSKKKIQDHEETLL